MFSKKIILTAISGLFVLATATSYAAQMQVSSNDVLAREAAEGPRGADNERPGEVHGRNRGGRLINDTGADILARRGADDPIPHPRGEGAGHPNSEDVNGMILARRGADDPVGSERPGEVHGQKRGGRLIDTGVEILARRGADDPVGSERPGEVHGQKRGGRLIDTGVEILARRGADDPVGSERPGEVHGQRRGGRA
jgi:hypothetical protein